MLLDAISLHDESLIKSWRFSGGEIGVRLLEDFSSRRIKLIARLNSSDDVMKLLLTKDALDHQGCPCIEVYIPYLSYSRQDRICSPGDSFSLFRFAQLLNSSHFSKVYTFDVHSEVAAQYISRFHPINNIRFASQVLCDQLDDVDYLVAPDKGALPKIQKLSEAVGNFPFVYAEKNRDPETGKILGLKFPESTVDLTGKNLLVVDDIGDGLFTFINLANEAKTLGANKLYLAMSHGIFSRGFDEIKKYYDQIFVTNSFKEADFYTPHGIKVFDLLSETF
jgi:ribose-phosphate pyrophosphokinase